MFSGLLTWLASGDKNTSFFTPMTTLEDSNSIWNIIKEEMDLQLQVGRNWKRKLLCIFKIALKHRRISLLFISWKLFKPRFFSLESEKRTNDHVLLCVNHFERFGCFEKSWAGWLDC